jgi:hypothetical protein
MRKTVTRGNIRLAGAIGDSAIGMLDEPVLPQAGGTCHVVFRPMDPGIGTTTIVQRLCGSNPIQPNPSSGVNGYRAVWSIEMDSVGTVRYESFFLWDVSYPFADQPDRSRAIFCSAKIICVLLAANGGRDRLREAAGWCRSNVSNGQRIIFVITKGDSPESGHLRPNEIEALGSEFDCPVVRIEGAHVQPETKHGLNPRIRNLVLTIDDALRAK